MWSGCTLKDHMTSDQTTAPRRRLIPRNSSWSKSLAGQFRRHNLEGNWLAPHRTTLKVRNEIRYVCIAPHKHTLDKLKMWVGCAHSVHNSYRQSSTAAFYRLLIVPQKWGGSWWWWRWWCSWVKLIFRSLRASFYAHPGPRSRMNAENPTNRENRPLVTDEAAEFERWPVQCQDFANGHFIHAGPLKGTGVSLYLSVKTSGKLPTFLEESVKYTSTYERNSGRSQLVTCRSDLETLGFWSIMLKNLSRQSALTPSHVFVGPTTPSLR